MVFGTRELQYWVLGPLGQQILKSQPWSVQFRAGGVRVCSRSFATQGAGEDDNTMEEDVAQASRESPCQALEQGSGCEHMMKVVGVSRKARGTIDLQTPWLLQPYAAHHSGQILQTNASRALQLIIVGLYKPSYLKVTKSREPPSTLYIQTPSSPDPQRLGCIRRSHLLRFSWLWDFTPSYLGAAQNQGLECRLQGK